MTQGLVESPETPAAGGDRSGRTDGGLLSALFMGVALAAAAAWGGPATEELRAAVTRVLQIVEDEELRKPANVEQRRRRIRDVARGVFDFEQMAQRSLGRHWPARTPEERRHFAQLFTDLLESLYVSKIEGYRGERVVYSDEQTDGDTVTVRSRLVSPRGPEIPIDYRLQKTAAGWKVYDVVIEGTSLVANYRTQFNRIIAQSSYEELVRRLEQKRLNVAGAGRPPGATSGTP
jgi:phospholipid transport system substrate-binding protein